MTGSRIRLGFAVAFLGLALSTGTAAAETLAGNGCSTPCDVAGEEITAPAEGQAAPELAFTPEAAETAPAGSLPFTGGDVAGLVALGAGTVMVRRTRSRASTSA
jgi:hypothetical protein